MAHPTIYGTTVAGQVATVQVPFAHFGDNARLIVAYQDSDAGSLYFTFDGSTPAVRAAGSYFVSSDLPALEVRLGRRSGSESIEVKLISSGATDYGILVLTD